MPKITVQYFAILREQRGLSEESLDTTESNPANLYAKLAAQHGFTLPSKSLRVAINDEFASMDQSLKDGDAVTFIAPVAGG